MGKRVFSFVSEELLNGQKFFFWQVFLVGGKFFLSLFFSLEEG